MAAVQAVVAASALHEVRLCSEFLCLRTHSLRVSGGRVWEVAAAAVADCLPGCGGARRRSDGGGHVHAVLGYIARAAVEEADQLDEYNADRIAAVFRRRPLLLARRLSQIAATLGWWAAVRYGVTLFGREDASFKKRASQLQGALVQLGLVRIG